MTLGLSTSISTQRPVAAGTFVVSAEFLVADKTQRFGSIVRTWKTNICDNDIELDWGR